MPHKICHCVMDMPKMPDLQANVTLHQRANRGSKLALVNSQNASDFDSLPVSESQVILTLLLIQE